MLLLAFDSNNRSTRNFLELKTDPINPADLLKIATEQRKRNECRDTSPSTRDDTLPVDCRANITHRTFVSGTGTAENERNKSAAAGRKLGDVNGNI